VGVGDKAFTKNLPNSRPTTITLPPLMSRFLRSVLKWLYDESGIKVQNSNKYELGVDGRKGVNFAKFRKKTTFLC